MNGVPMNNAPHLLAEDRPDFERILDDALRDGTILTALRTPGALTGDQLRIQALRAADGVAAAAATEYEHYLRLRESLRSTPPAAHDGEPGAPGLLTQLRSGSGGAGLFPVLTVLTPILAWAAALVLLLLGYVLRAADPEPALARSLLTAGWVALAAGVVAMVVGIVGLILTALRDGSTVPAPAGADPDLAAELADARREWQRALRDRALLPYLHAALRAEPAPPTPAAVPAQAGDPARPDARRPDTPGPDAPRPEYSSPDFSSPGYTGPGFSSPGAEGLTDPEGREPRTATFTTPDFTGPGYTGPAFTSPDDV
ncbi:hypothetical protein J5Y04_30005 [Kitasatospora sp. RG8]|uniref:hypothetical protein n=1 Tax=Kitasatospora sp. RG8 TaxID=2820815 RepID=UPI001AE0896F|nr:hypothetical protein [Kitasatospora sp. RG8]MBP0453746.1 hypothetical protein [Kitasatospora sp. RG8]